MRQHMRYACITIILFSSRCFFINVHNNGHVYKFNQIKQHVHPICIFHPCQVEMDKEDV